LYDTTVVVLTEGGLYYVAEASMLYTMNRKNAKVCLP